MSIDTFLLSADTTDLNYPEVRPTLDLNFARVKALDPRITFTRASGGSYVGADGYIKFAGVNEARFDHDPVTGESLGLLVEESRSNLLVRSSTPDTLLFSGNWGKGTNTTRIGTTTAPDGTNDAVYYSGDGSGGNEFVSQPVSLSSNTTYTVSVWAKLISGSTPTSGNIITAAYNNGTGEARSNVSFNGNLTTEWKRFSTTYTNINATTANQFFTADQNNTAQIAIWGPQLEVGSFPTSYIPTVASTRTRAADNASITGKNFSEWYRRDEGSIVAKSSMPTNRSYSGTFRSMVQFIKTSTYNSDSIFSFINDVGQYNASNTSSSTTNVDMSQSSSYSPGDISAFAYKVNDYALSTKGLSVSIDTSGVVATGIDRMIIGNVGDNNPSGCINGTIARLTYYPKRLPNAQLQALTR